MITEANIPWVSLEFCEKTQQGAEIGNFEKVKLIEKLNDIKWDMQLTGGPGGPPNPLWPWTPWGPLSPMGPEDPGSPVLPYEIYWNDLNEFYQIHK